MDLRWHRAAQGLLGGMQFLSCLLQDIPQLVDELVVGIALVEKRVKILLHLRGLLLQHSGPGFLRRKSILRLLEVLRQLMQGVVDARVSPKDHGGTA